MSCCCCSLIIGRVNFYDDVGVIRDVMQNHLTEIAILIGMELPDDSGIIRDILNNKVTFLQHIDPLTERDILIGQYMSYSEQCRQELSHAPNSTNTPTFGVAVFSVNTPRWRGIPFVLISGKRLDEKLSYVRLIFKNDEFHLKQTRSSSSTTTQIIFHITSGNQLELDRITVSKQLPKPATSNKWDLVESVGNNFFFGESINNTYQLVPRMYEDAYTLLLEATYLGQRHFFINRQSLLMSWKIWDPVLMCSEKRKPRLYKGRGADVDHLDFRILSDKSLEFLHSDDVMEVQDVEIPGFDLPQIRQTPATFHGSQLITGRANDVIAKLAFKIEKAAKEAIAARGAFHMALPGGKSPIPLFQYLSAWIPQFPWLHTHIWQVDERCLPMTDVNSNFHLINTKLIEHIPVPYLNIHPMPVDLINEPCSVKDSGDKLYESKLNKLLVNATLDFVLLGVGHDGHIASLFPNQTSLNEANNSVIYSTAGPGVISPKRMTLTFPILNRSRLMAILIVGVGKHDLIEHLANCDDIGMTQYPVLGLNPPSQSELIWYIDEKALFGEL